MLTIKHLIKSVDRRTQMENKSVDRRKQMKNFKKYFNEDFDLEEAVEFKNAEKRKEFNRHWVTKFKDILLNDSLCYYYNARPWGGG